MRQKSGLLRALRPTAVQETWIRATTWSGEGPRIQATCTCTCTAIWVLITYLSSTSDFPGHLRYLGLHFARFLKSEITCGTSYLKLEMQTGTVSRASRIPNDMASQDLTNGHTCFYSSCNCLGRRICPISSTPNPLA